MELQRINHLGSENAIENERTARAQYLANTDVVEHA